MGRFYRGTGQFLPVSACAEECIVGGLEVGMRYNVLVILGVLSGAAVPCYAATVDLVPHRAVYSMDLSSTQSGSGIVGAHGTMSYEFSDACDGWVVENRLAIHYAYVEGGEVDTTTDFVTWESKDGLKYRFRLRNTRDGQVTDEIEGDASLRGRGQGGNARYTRPTEMTKSLPKGTLFPTIHTRELVSEAEKGGHLVHRVVFDGSDTQGAFDVNALIGLPKAIPASVSFPQLGTPSWPVRLAFFPLQGDEAEPDFEMSIDYHANGIAQSVTQGFKGFSLAGHLESLESVKRQSCETIAH